MGLEPQLIFDSLTEAVVILNSDGDITNTNKSARALLGYGDDQLEGKHIGIIYGDQDDVNRFDYELSSAVKKSNFISAGWKSRQNGSKFWGEHSISPIYKNGKHVGYTCVLRDMTETKNEALDLRARGERFRLMIESIKDYAIILLDINGNISTWNDGAHYITGYTANEIAGKHVSILYPESAIRDTKGDIEMRTALETGKYEEEGWRLKKNGSVFWAYVVITALYNENNTLLGFSKVIRDLSDKKNYEEKLLLSEERHRLLVEQVSDYGIFMLDEKGRIISWNEGARKIKGYTANEILGKYFSIFYPEEDIMNGKPAYELKIAVKEGKYEEEGWRIRKDGSRFWANIVITAIYNSGGTLIGFSKVTRDLTERKQSEKALRDSYERYRQLAGALKTANEELSHANVELEQFTSIVSHDLQEPVRTIKSFLQLIDIKLDEIQSNELKAYITKSINAANRMRELINNLLHYSQLSKGELVEEIVNPEDLVNQALQNLKSSIDYSKAVITFDNRVNYVKGDRIQLVQLIQNLISNALKFTASETPRIVIRCEVADNIPTFSISDNGIGIAKSDMGKVFEIFRRLDTKNIYPGTGIGLAICKKIVDRHNGRIWPESVPGRGTTFYFTLNETQTKRLAAS